MLKVTTSFYILGKLNSFVTGTSTLPKYRILAQFLFRIHKDGIMEA